MSECNSTRTTVNTDDGICWASCEIMCLVKKRGKENDKI